MSEPLAEVRSVEKSFGAVRAVRDATCAFAAGRVHAVCGENGAGKSTLLKIACGLVQPDAGEVRVGGSALVPHTAAEAIRRGTAMVLQHFALVPVFTLLENLVLGAEPVTGPFGVLDMEAARARARKVFADLGIALQLDARVEELGVGDRQRLEIARALYRDARLLVLDEPTAVLTRTEAEALYAQLGALARAGRGVVVVTHKMDEVEAHADVVTVMRRGELLFTEVVDRDGDVAAQIDRVERAIMGDGAGHATVQGASPAAEAAIVARVDGACVDRALDGLTLEVRAGEIVGVAGIEGNGQRELVELLSGALAPERGSVAVSPRRGAPPDATTRARAVVREDRHREGLVLDASVRDNLVLGELTRFARFGVVRPRDLEEEASRRLRGTSAPQDLERPARTLSGGNQQKIVMARALARLSDDEAPLLVAAQPTRGVDLGAAADLRARVKEAAAAGSGVVVVSSDLDELRALSSRILVMRRGRIVAEVGADASDEELGRHMLGRTESEPAEEAS